MRFAHIAPRPKQVLIGSAAAVLVSALLAGVTYARTTIPSPSAIASQQTTTIYYSDGKTVLARLGTTNRTDVTLSQVPLTVQHAVLAAEDRHFYSEPGVSPTGIIRALAVDIRGGDISQGGSTITQQYAKNAYLSSQRSLTRKLKEIFIATKLGQTRSKSTILTDYLNTIYFGRNAYGIQAAAQAYFPGVSSVSQLTTAQGALLAAVVRGPSLYDPQISKTTKANAKARWHYVLNGMVTEGWLKAKRAAHLKFPKTRSLKNALSGASACSGATCYIRDAVEHELIDTDGLSQSQIDLGGYKIVTTINKTAEQSLIDAEHATLPANNKGTPESGAASIKPGDGAIEALYGGSKYCHKPKLNKDACIDLSGYTGQWARPPGSSFKAFTLIAALEKGISLTSRFDGPTSVEVNGTDIHNSSPGESCFGCTLLKAFAQSINTIFVPLAKQVGPQKVVDAAYAAGIPKSRSLQPFPDIALGPNNVSPVDLANAYATIAAQGIHADPYLVDSVTSTTGQRIFKATKHLSRVFPSDITSDTTYAMTKVLAPGGTAYGRGLSGRPAAGKTGTTDNNTNAWFTGFTPQLCTSVWIGNVDPTETVSAGGVGEVFGGTLPAEIWQATMNGALAGQPVLQFPTPSNVGHPENSTTASPSATATATATATITPSISPSITPTISPSVTPSITPTITPTLVPPTTPPTLGATKPGLVPAVAGSSDRRTPPTGVVITADGTRMSSPTGPPRGVIPPSSQDPLVAGTSELVGGRWGRHAGEPTSWWWTPLRVALACTVLVTVFAYLQKAPCLTHPYTNEYQYTRLCYTDTYALYTAEGLNAKVNGAGVATGRVSVPYRDHPVEYPPVIGGLMWAAAETTAIVHPGAADVGGVHNETFFNLTALGLAICALISTWTVAKLAGRRRAWDAAMVALSPMLFMHAFTNWDLAAIAATGLGMWAWSRGSPVWAGALLGVGIATKLYPIFVLLALIMLCARAGKWRAGGKALLGSAAGVVVCYLPAVLVSKSFLFPDATCPGAHQLAGWRWFLSLSQTRGADWGSVWLVGQHLFHGDRFGRTLLAQPACGASPTTLNVLSAACVLVVIAGVGALVALAPRRPRVAQIAFLLVAGFIVFNKVDSPQYALWLVPLAVLARPRWTSLLIWQASEVILGAANLYTLIAIDHSDQGLPLDTYLVILVVRDLVLFWLMAMVVREVWVPREDIVRRDGVDDPAGGVLDGALDAGLQPRHAAPLPAH